MILFAEITLTPSFHATHAWRADVDGDRGTVAARSGGTIATWRLQPGDLASMPPELVAGTFPLSPDPSSGCDGVVADFHIRTPALDQSVSLWCPRFATDRPHAALLKWCWEGLYLTAAPDYRVLLEQLHSYFDWGAPIRATPTGLRIFGGLSFREMDELKRQFDSALRLKSPVIDMTNFDGAGGILHPIFKDFFLRAPQATWLVNPAARRHLTAAGIPENVLLQTAP